MPHLYKYLIFPRQQLWGLLNSCREDKAREKKKQKTFQRAGRRKPFKRCDVSKYKEGEGWEESIFGCSKGGKKMFFSKNLTLW